MRFGYYIKIKAYRFFSSLLGKSVLRLLSAFVNVKGLAKDSSENKRNFVVSITIDTESGYVENNDYRVWQKAMPTAYIGFYKGIENWRKLFNKHKVKATFFLSTNCFSAEGKEYAQIIKQLRLLLREGHEIGLHLHPDSDLALQKQLGKKFGATSAKFYSKEEINEIIACSKSLVKKNLGINVTSFRWGNWALSTDAVGALQQNKFKIDSSAAPGTKGHKNDGMQYDWSKVYEHYPWALSNTDYTNTKHWNSGIIEIPIATFNFFGFKLRADPANSVLLPASFEYYYNYTDRSKKPFVFVVISHSSEATHESGNTTKVVKSMEEFIINAKKHKETRFLALRDCYSMIRW